MTVSNILMPVHYEAINLDILERAFAFHRLWEAPDQDALIESIKDDIEYIISSPGEFKIDSAFMRKFPKLKAVCNYGVGYDAVDAAWAGQQGIIVTNTPDVLNDEVADMSIGLTLAVLREIPSYDSFVRKGEWGKISVPMSASMIGRTMGIVGLGRIGKAIAKRAEAFGVRILYHGRHKQDVPFAYYPKLIEMAKDCDILMLIAPGTAETHHMVNKEVLEALGKDGILINMARGSLVDEEALIEALEKHTILSAGLDVYEHEPHVPERLRALPHVVLLPHVGAHTHITRAAILQLVIDNVKAMLEGKPPLTPVAETPVK